MKFIKKSIDIHRKSIEIHRKSIENVEVTSVLYANDDFHDESEDLDDGSLQNRFIQRKYAGQGTNLFYDWGRWGGTIY